MTTRDIADLVTAYFEAKTPDGCDEARKVLADAVEEAGGRSKALRRQSHKTVVEYREEHEHEAHAGWSPTIESFWTAEERRMFFEGGCETTADNPDAIIWSSLAAYEKGEGKLEGIVAGAE